MKFERRNDTRRKEKDSIRFLLDSRAGLMRAHAASEQINSAELITSPHKRTKHRQTEMDGRLGEGQWTERVERNGRKC